MALGAILCLSPSKHHYSCMHSLHFLTPSSSFLFSLPEMSFCPATLTCFAPLSSTPPPLSIMCSWFLLFFCFWLFPPLLFPLKSLMPVSILLFALSHPLPFSSDWLRWCSSRVTGLCGPWSSLALTACYLHGDGWLRRCRALHLTTAEDRAHTWDTSPTLSHLLTLSVYVFFLIYFFNFCFPSSCFLWFWMEKLLWGYMVDWCLLLSWWHLLWGVPLDGYVCVCVYMLNASSTCFFDRRLIKEHQKSAFNSQRHCLSLILCLFSCLFSVISSVFAFYFVFAHKLNHSLYASAPPSCRCCLSSNLHLCLHLLPLCECYTYFNETLQVWTVVLLPCGKSPFKKRGKH